MHLKLQELKEAAKNGTWVYKNNSTSVISKKARSKEITGYIILEIEDYSAKVKILGTNKTKWVSLIGNFSSDESQWFFKTSEEALLDLNRRIDLKIKNLKIIKKELEKTSNYFETL